MHPLKSMRVQMLDNYPEGFPYPGYAHEGDSGFDLRAAVTSPIDFRDGERTVIPCGIAVEVPPGFELQVRSRSGLAAKYGLFVLNSPGTVDAGYRGELKVIMALHASGCRVRLDPGDRIAQAVLAPVAQAQMYFQLGSLDETERGEGGFGSTGF